jgi:phage tail sheath protein FI
MAETLLSPGVLTRENDTSQITQGPIVAGAAIVGPTVKGPVNIPTLVTSYSDYLNKFGGTFVSGGTTNEYLTSISAYNYFQQGGASLLVTRAVSGAFSPATSSAILSYNTSASFILETLSAGAIQNSTSTVGTNGILPSGSADNVRFEIVGSSTGSGVFSLLIRQGNDTDNSKIILEAWNNLSLDPNQSNYIEAVIGNQSVDISQGYTNVSGDYTNKSRYVRVKQVLTSSVNYFDNNGTPVSSLTGSVPTAQTGSFGSATGTNTSIFGLVPDNYTSSLNLLANQDEFKFNVITIPGQTTTSGSAAITRLISLAQDRGDVISIIDVTNKGESVATAVANALSYDNSYAAAYYPWVQVNAPNTGKLTWVPPSTIIPSVFAYNDRVSAPWFAPAGFTRGGLSVIQAERKLSPSDRDTLYVGNVNSIATFPGQGVVAYGQKTLQKKASALDRINVRRLLIELKSYIGQIANTLVFEQNTNSTRNRFLSQVNPYLDSIQQRQGLYAYKVVMDDTNNTADVIDRNQLVGQIFIQPTKTAEFIILDFNVTPTGATF